MCMVWIDVTIKKNVHVHTYALQAIARFLRQGGAIYKVCFDYFVNWQLFTQIRHFITQLDERSSRVPTFLNLSSLWAAPSGVPTLLFWNRIIFVIVIIISISTIITSNIDCHHRYHHLYYYDHIYHHTDVQFEIIDNDGVKTAVAWKTYSNRPFERCGLGILAIVSEGEAEVDLVLIKTCAFLWWKLCCNKAEKSKVNLTCNSMFLPCHEEPPIQPAWEHLLPVELIIKQD